MLCDKENFILSNKKKFKEKCGACNFNFPGYLQLFPYNLYINVCGNIFPTF